MLVIGDIGIDTILKVAEKDAEIEPEQNETQICFQYGEKIPVQTRVESPGGNAANVSVGTARLGIHTALNCITGEDTDGEKLIKKLTAEGVSTESVTQSAKTNHSTALIYNGERTIFVFHETRNYRGIENISSDWVYLTSLGEKAESIYESLIGFKSQESFKLIFAPGTYQLRAGAEKFEELFKVCDFLLLNRSEAAELLTKSEIEPIETLLKGIISLGTKAAVITDGVNGAYCQQGAFSWHVPAYPADLVDSTGAGDAFASGLVSGLIFNKTIEQALAWGSVNSASVVSQTGPQSGLLTNEQIEQKINFSPIIANKL